LREDLQLNDGIQISSLFDIMFTLRRDPFDCGAAYWFQQPRYSRRQSLFERYLDALDQQFFSILKGNVSELLGLENENVADKPKTLPSAQSSESAPSSSSATPPHTPTPGAKPKSTDSAPDPVCQVPQYKRQFCCKLRYRVINS
jgi:hypothetical protein